MIGLDNPSLAPVTCRSWRCRGNDAELNDISPSPGSALSGPRAGALRRSTPEASRFSAARIHRRHRPGG